MTQTPGPPAGWYPQGDQERWWDGTAWSDNVRPLGSGQPAYQPMFQGQTPVKQSHLARNILIVFGVLFLLFVGGCVALVAVVGKQVGEVVNDDTPGGPNNPLTITEGQGFDVYGFEYADGWSISDGLVTHLFDIEDLKVTNHRDKADRLYVEISLLNDGEVLATAFCSTAGGVDTIPEDTTVTVDCSSSDDLPPAYNRITIRDVI